MRLWRNTTRPSPRLAQYSARADRLGRAPARWRRRCSAPSMCVTEVSLRRISNTTNHGRRARGRTAVLTSAADERLQLIGGVADRRDEQDAREHEPGHEGTLRDRARTAMKWVNVRAARARKIKRIELRRAPPRPSGRQPARSPGGIPASAGSTLAAGMTIARESHLHRLAHPQRRLRNPANLAAQPDFAEDRRRRAPARGCGRSTPPPPPRSGRRPAPRSLIPPAMFT